MIGCINVNSAHILGKEGLLKKLNRELKKNKIKDDDIISIQFTQIDDVMTITDHLSVFYKISK